MNGRQLRAARRARGVTQVALARALGVSQGYVSLLERGRRAVPAALTSKCVAALGMPPTMLPMGQAAPLNLNRASRALGAFGYEGFAYLEGGRRVNPAEFLLRVLRAERVDARVVAALPWLLVKYPDLDWPAVVRTAKLEDLQNRLGFVVSLAAGLAESRGSAAAAHVLNGVARRLEHSRLQKSDSFARGALTEAEEKWLRTHGSDEARRWNVLSTLSADTLRDAG